MKELEIAIDLLEENECRLDVGLQDVLPEWALYKINCYLHRKWLESHPEFVFTNATTKDIISIKDPNFDFFLDNKGIATYTIKTYLGIEKGYISSQLLLNGKRSYVIE